MPQVQALQREGDELRPLRRHQLAVLPVAGLDPHRPLSAQHRRADATCRRAGGFAVFHTLEERHVRDQPAGGGLPTALMGKYLNGYRPLATARVRPARLVGVGGRRRGYANYNYTLLVKHPDGAPPEIVRYGARPVDYLTDVISRRGQAVHRRGGEGGRPFMLELSTFTPHAPFTPAPRDACAFPEPARAARPAVRRAAARRRAVVAADRRRSRREQIAELDADFRMRAQSVQAIDR